jgi:glycosyltransferase involved in cell wall biosynthesis
LNFNYPVKYRKPFVVVIHDMTLFFYPETAKKTNFIKEFAFKYVFKKALYNSKKIIAISENTKKDILEIFPVKPEKIAVVYEGADDNSIGANGLSQAEKDSQALKLRYALGDMPVLLYVGQFRAHKNIPGLIQAFNILSEKLPAKLVLVGKVDPNYQELVEAIDKSAYKEDIVMPGFTSDNELRAWYKTSNIFVFPSFYEGFGLPGLEAMTARLPVAASDCASIPEIYGRAAIYFDPSNPADIANSILKVLTDEKLKSYLVEEGRKTVKKYSWRKCAEATLKIIREISNYSN